MAQIIPQCSKNHKTVHTSSPGVLLDGTTGSGISMQLYTPTVSLGHYHLEQVHAPVKAVLNTVLVIPSGYTSGQYHISTNPDFWELLCNQSPPPRDMCFHTVPKITEMGTHHPWGPMRWGNDIQHFWRTLQHHSQSLLTQNRQPNMCLYK